MEPLLLTTSVQNQSEGANRPDENGFGFLKPNAFVGAVIALTRRCPGTWLGKRLAFALRRIGKVALGSSSADVEVLGVKFRLTPRDNTCEKRLLYTPQFFEPDSVAWLLTRASPGFIFLDVGANAGAYALLVAAKVGGSGRTIAIEADPRMFARLSRNARFNSGLQIELVHCAVADGSSEVRLFRHPRNLGETSIKACSASTQANSFLVKAQPLAEIIASKGLSRVDAVKLDIEGAEDMVLSAFFRDAPVSLWPGLILMETLRERWSFNVEAMLVDIGYRKIRQFGPNAAFELLNPRAANS